MGLGLALFVVSCNGVLSVPGPEGHGHDSTTGTHDSVGDDSPTTSDDPQPSEDDSATSDSGDTATGSGNDDDDDGPDDDDDDDDGDGGATTGDDDPSNNQHTPGYLHTDGGAIVDYLGNPVRLTGITWIGFDTTSFAPQGLWKRTLVSFVEQIAELGYNSLRIPFANAMLLPENAPSSVQGDPTLAGLSGIEVLDALVNAADAAGLKIVLSRSRSRPNAGNTLWYDESVDEDAWIRDWEELTILYKNDPTIVGMDLHDEPHGPATWGSESPSTDWNRAAERAGNAILRHNDQLLIFVQGIELYEGDLYWSGGNLRGVASTPIRLNEPNQLVYAPHTFPRSVQGSPWLPDDPDPVLLRMLWDENWGYIARDNTAPILIGAFGTNLETEWDKAWMAALGEYISDRELSFFYWTLNFGWGATGGLLDADWETVIERKQTALAPMLAPFIE